MGSECCEVHSWNYGLDIGGVGGDGYEDEEAVVGKWGKAYEE